MTLTSGASSFHHPFIGHLPGFIEVADTLAPNPWGNEPYARLLSAQWKNLIDSNESRQERVLQSFLERHPSLLPGSHTLDCSSGRWPFPFAVISQPKLPGLSMRQPDFLWIASNSTTVYPVLIEIETPHKRWFRAKGNEFHSDFSHALGQLIELAAWFTTGNNAASFKDYYEFPEYLRELVMVPRFVLIHGRRSEYEGNPVRKAKIAMTARHDQRLMSFDRLTPELKATCVGCVRKLERGYKAVCVPPTFSISTGDLHKSVPNWLEAIEQCEDMPEHRKEMLREGIYDKLDVETYPSGLKVYTTRWY